MVTTTADLKIREARKHVMEATDALADVVVHQCSGHDEYASEAMDTFREVLVTLISLHGKF